MRLRGLTLRIYLVGLVQVAAVLGTLALVHWLTFQPGRHPHFRAEALLSAKLIEEAVAESGSARRETMRIHEVLGGTLSVYAADGKLLESNSSPGLPPLSAEDAKEVLAGREVLARDPVVVSVPLKLLGKRAYLRFSPRLPPRPPPMLVVGMLAALFAGGIGAVLLARSLAAPLAKLGRAAQALGDGDLTARAAVQRTDELGDLSVAFDHMAEQLGEMVRAQQELIANVSHELRTPLARIRVALDLAQEGDAEMAKESLMDITDDLGELERLVADVLQSARLDLAQGRARAALPALRREPVDFDALLDKSVARFQQAEPQRTLDVNRSTLPLVQGDPMLLRRALDNLLDNAAAYSEPGTPIALFAGEEGDKLVLRVSDRGIGIAREHIPLLTRPFFRADPSRTRKTGGYGLGLSLCSRIMASHGGAMRIESELGRGTSVTLELPREA